MLCVPKGFDTKITEQMVRQSSHRIRLDTIHDEMLRRVDERRIMGQTLASYESVYGQFNILPSKDHPVHSHSFFDKYVTSEEMVFGVTFNNSDKCELAYNDIERLRKPVWNRSLERGVSYLSRFLNPIGSYIDLSNALFAHSGITEFMKKVKEQVPGTDF